MSNLSIGLLLAVALYIAAVVLARAVRKYGPWLLGIDRYSGAIGIVDLFGAWQVWWLAGIGTGTWVMW